MAYVDVIVVDPNGNEYDAKVDPDSTLEVIERDLLSAMKLSPSEGYNIRKIPKKIVNGSVIVIDKSSPTSVQLGPKR